MKPNLVDGALRGKYSDDDEEDDDDSESGEKGRSSRGKWTAEEDDILREAVLTHGGRNWKKISEYLDGRTDVQCLHRWQKVLRPGLVKGPWTVEEDESVIQLVAKHGVKSWSFIARQLKGRLGKQCRERWYNHLNPAISKTPWTEEEDRLIIDCHEKYGNKWAVIATFLPGRTDNAIKNRWNSTLQRLLKQSSDGILRRKKVRVGSGRRGGLTPDGIDDCRSARSIDGSYSESVASEEYSLPLYDSLTSMTSSAAEARTYMTPANRNRGYPTGSMGSGDLDHARMTMPSGRVGTTNRPLSLDDEGQDRDQVLREMRWKLRMRTREKAAGSPSPGGTFTSLRQFYNCRDSTPSRPGQDQSRSTCSVPVERIPFDRMSSPSILRRPPTRKRASNALLDSGIRSDSPVAVASSTSSASLQEAAPIATKTPTLPPAKRFHYDSERVLSTPSPLGVAPVVRGAPAAHRSRAIGERGQASVSSSPRRESLRGIFQSSEKSRDGADIGSPSRQRSSSTSSEGYRNRRDRYEPLPAQDRRATPKTDVCAESSVDSLQAGVGSTSSETCDDSPKPRARRGLLPKNTQSPEKVKVHILTGDDSYTLS